MISVVQLGRIDYATGLRLQQRLVELRKAGAVGDVLLLLEHTPVITLGRNAKVANVLASPQQLATKGVELFECDRGGDVTFHGPGQLVAYPVFDLSGLTSKTPNRKHLGAIEYVRNLEEVLIRTCHRYGIATTRVTGLTGVWTEEQERKPQAKIAAIGVHISRAITSHGFALNVNTDLTYFNLIIPCGITSKPVTSIERELHGTVSLPEVASTVVKIFAEVFESPIRQVENLDALVHPTGLPLKTPTELQRLHKEERIHWA